MCRPVQTHLLLVARGNKFHIIFNWQKSFIDPINKIFVIIYTHEPANTHTQLHVHVYIFYYFLYFDLIFSHYIDSSYKVGVFCLFRLGNQVVDTPSLIEVDRSMVDVTFPDFIIL